MRKILSLVPLALALAAALPACASSPADEAPQAGDVVRRPDVPASSLARELGLVLREDDRQAVLESASGTRILLFPGTRIATVAGRRLDLGQTVAAAGGETWIGWDDAARVRATWAVAVANGADAPVPDRPSPTGAGPAIPAPPPRGGLPVAPRPDVFGPANRPSAAETAAWSVPLKRRWNYIVIHHSASATGSAAEIDRWHRDKGWDGLGYDFVIGNGTGSRDGLVEVGYRWRRQLDGAHARTSARDNRMNEEGIGICLVGDFSKTRPTPAQMAALERLCLFLSDYCDIPAANLRLHGDVKSTECPGRHFPRDFMIRGVAGGRGTSPSTAANPAAR